MSEDVITIRLGLPEFRMLSVSESRHRIEVWVEKITCAEPCPGCGRFSCQGYDERWDDVWDRPLGDKGVLLWVRKRRFGCVNRFCTYYQRRKPFPERYSSIGPGHHRTHRLERYIYRLSKHMANTDVVKELACCHTPVSDNTVGRIQQRLGDQELAGCEPGRVVAIGLDEYSVWRGHRYATIITNPIRHTVVETFLGRDKDTVVQHLQALFPAGSIKLAVIDMRGGYQRAVLAVFPQAKIIIDKFHVVSVVMDALDATRKRVQRRTGQTQRRQIFDLCKCAPGQPEILRVVDARVEVFEGASHKNPARAGRPTGRPADSGDRVQRTGDCEAPRKPQAGVGRVLIREDPWRHETRSGRS